MKALLSIYRPRFVVAVVYMLQSEEYRAGRYLAWLWRTRDFSRVMIRRQLILTKPARLLLRSLQAGMAVEYVVSLLLVYVAWHHQAWGGVILALILMAATPVIWAHLIVAPLIAGRWFVIKPRQWGKVRQAERIFANHSGAKIAIAGSYGKTTMKEILAIVLGEGHKVAATSGNKNVPISHASFARKLSGDEDILIIEYGEGAPGDVSRFARITHPNMGIITGLAPAHLDKYKSVAAAGEDIFSLADYLGGKDVYVNSDSHALESFIKPEYVTYSSKKVGGWSISKVNNTLEGLSFTMKRQGKTIEVDCAMVGKHLVGPIALAVYFADEMGMSEDQIKEAVSHLKPYEHRMQPYQLNGAWIIDDSYNGNIEGMKAGLAMLKELKATRKIYVTPGLVDQGPEEKPVHLAPGEAIKKANPDKVVLMKHSVTDYILEGLNGYGGELIIEDSPLDFYTHLDKSVAAGDLVLMQNDWPDQYN